MIKEWKNSIMQYKNDELFKLQKLFRAGMITENQIPELQLRELKNLYHKQISGLENSIETDKQRILKIKSQL